MAKLLVFAAVLGVAYGGGRRLSESASRPILDGFETLCRSGQVSASGALVDLAGEPTWVYCKSAGGRSVIENTQEKTFEVREPPPQAVFVNPPDISLRQRVLVTGTVKAPRTKIFYVPNKVDTSVDIDVQSQTERPNKPTVYFLNDGRQSGSSSGSSSFGRTRPSLSDDTFGDEDQPLDLDSTSPLSQLSRSELLAILRRNQERERDTGSSPISSSLGQLSTAQLQALLERNRERAQSDADTVASFSTNSPRVSFTKKREAPFTHAIKISEKEGKTRLLLLRKAD